jgi:hypothetical protein
MHVSLEIMQMRTQQTNAEKCVNLNYWHFICLIWISWHTGYCSEFSYHVRANNLVDADAAAFANQEPTEMKGPLTADEPKFLVAAPASVCEAKIRRLQVPKPHKHCTKMLQPARSCSQISTAFQH